MSRQLLLSTVCALLCLAVTQIVFDTTPQDWYLPDFPGEDSCANKTREEVAECDAVAAKKYNATDDDLSPPHINSYKLCCSLWYSLGCCYRKMFDICNKEELIQVTEYLAGYVGYMVNNTCRAYLPYSPACKLD